jgi:hypothetical protein
MKKNTYFLNTALAVVYGVAMVAEALVHAFLPRIILPQWNSSELVLVSLAALLIDHYMAPGAKRCYICIPVFSAIAFGLLSFAGYLGIAEALRIAVLGCVVFTATTWLFSSMVDRISSGPAAKAAPIVSAIGLYLAVQCLMGIV